MLYSARWKKITVDQKTVLKNRLFRFLGPPGIRFSDIMYTENLCFVWLMSLYLKDILRTHSHFTFFPNTWVSLIFSERELVVGVFSQDDEEVVLGVGRIPRPVPQVHSQRVPLLRCQTMDLLVPQPVFTDNESETRLVFGPRAVEVHDAVFPPLEHLQIKRSQFIWYKEYLWYIESCQWKWSNNIASSEMDVSGQHAWFSASNWHIVWHLVLSNHWRIRGMGLHRGTELLDNSYHIYYFRRR